MFEKITRSKKEKKQIIVYNYTAEVLKKHKVVLVLYELP